MVFIKPAALLAVSSYVLSIQGKTTPQHLELQPQYHNGTVKVEHLSVPGNLDGFKMLTPAARSSADFWYFDVFSESTNQTLNIVFFNSGDFSQYPHPLAVQVSGVYSNGSDFYYEALADDGVSITNGPSGIYGDWKGIGSFQGSSLDARNVEYHINLDSQDMGISGSIKFKSNLLPGLYWANAVPDAETVVDLTVKDTKIRFKDGVRYHDKNWGNQSIVDGPRYWDWGHGRFGPYSVVWYNLLDYEGKESRRSFVVKNGKVMMVSCDPKSMEVRQKGGKANWPPTTGLLETEGLTVQYSLPDGQEPFLDVTTELIVRDEKGACQRANGRIKGGIKGKKVYEGRAHYEEFIFGIVNDYTPK
ncbi:Hydroxyneurosporene synthase [Fusarium albosuccineum]|uniref:Hydroxyneurosporene synthase n=1 Tax=Fusarium albosuccineum TaxID=1237068 RepID=A0A8H4LB24_9HYPO|nr:Hydroxyneurosporene synthase [Fusarium albosuccineum]